MQAEADLIFLPVRVEEPLIALWILHTGGKLLKMPQDLSLNICWTSHIPEEQFKTTCPPPRPHKKKVIQRKN